MDSITASRLAEMLKALLEDPEVASEELNEICDELAFRASTFEEDGTLTNDEGFTARFGKQRFQVTVIEY